MAENNQSLIVVGSTAHYLSIVKQIGSQAVWLTLKADELHPIENPAYESKIVPADTEAAHGKVVFYKREGKFMVLLGREIVKEKLLQGALEIRGQLMSGPMLKRCRVDEVDGTVIPIVTTPHPATPPKAIFNPMPVEALVQVETKKAEPVYTRPVLTAPVADVPAAKVEEVKTVTQPSEINNGEQAIWNGKLVMRSHDGRLFDVKPLNERRELKPPRTPYAQVQNRTNRPYQAQENPPSEMPAYRDSDAVKGKTTIVSRTPRSQYGAVRNAARYDRPALLTRQYDMPNAPIEPGQDRPMDQYPMVDKIRDEGRGAQWQRSARPSK